MFTTDHFVGDLLVRPVRNGTFRLGVGIFAGDGDNGGLLIRGKFGVASLARLVGQNGFDGAAQGRFGIGTLDFESSDSALPSTASATR